MGFNSLYDLNMEKSAITRELLRLKEETFPGIDKDQLFLKAGKIHRGTLTQLRSGSLPSILTIEKCTLACNVPLSQFVARLEALEVSGKKKGVQPKSGPSKLDALISSIRLLADRGNEKDLDLALKFVQRICA